jgi:diacylglycerol kinase (ATP)
VTASEATSTRSAGSARTRAVVVLNPKAGQKVGLPMTNGVETEGVVALLDAVGIDAEAHPTASEHEAVAVVRDAARNPDVPVVAAGGDGTLRVVARTLLEASDGDPEAVPALGILPLGSVMNVARSLDIPRELDAAAHVLGAGRVRTIDVGDVAGREPFLEGVAVGLHAELFAAGAAFDARDGGASLSAIGAALRFRPSRLTLELDDDRVVRTRALVISVSNGPYTGIGFTVAPGARMDDGLLDVRVFERFSRWELLRHFVSIAAGRRRYEPRVSTYRSARVRLTSVTPLRVRADGEDVGWTPVEIRVRRRALRVIAPPR